MIGQPDVRHAGADLAEDVEDLQGSSWREGDQLLQHAWVQLILRELQQRQAAGRMVKDQSNMFDMVEMRE